MGFINKLITSSGPTLYKRWDFIEPRLTVPCLVALHHLSSSFLPASHLPSYGEIFMDKMPILLTNQGLNMFHQISPKMFQAFNMISKIIGRPEDIWRPHIFPRSQWLCSQPLWLKEEVACCHSWAALEWWWHTKSRSKSKSDLWNSNRGKNAILCKSMCILFGRERGAV